jgi:hypothetical protein
LNLKVQKKSRRALKVGDIFSLEPPDGRFLFGRVVSTDGVIGPMKGCILIYIYDVRADTKQAPAELHRDHLLIPPQMTNRLPWSRGYFEFLENRELLDVDTFAPHCFEDNRNPPRYFDADGTQLAAPVEPVAEWGLQSFRTIDDQVSRALGIPLAPD